MIRRVIGLDFVMRDESGELRIAGKKKIRAEGDNTLLEGYTM